MSDVQDKAIDEGYEGFDSADEDVVETPASEETTDETEVAQDEQEETEGEEVQEETQDDQTEETETSESESEEAEAETDDQAEIARQAYLEREQKRREQQAQAEQELNDYVQNVPDEDEHGDPIPEYQREIIARQRAQEVELYKQRVANNTERLQTQFEKAQNSIPVFQSKDPVIQEALGDFIDEFQARHVSIDNYGNPVEVTGDLVQFLQSKAQLVERLTKTGAVQEKKASAKTRSHASPAPLGSQTKEVKDDPMMEGFDSYE